MSQYRKLEADRNYIYGRIDQVLSNMEDGSDKFITYQISNYIADLIAYTAGHRDVMDAIDGKGVCATYAFLYKIMAERVGIRTDIIYGTAYETDAGYTTKSDGAKSKVGHAWNKSLIDGKYYYYDITWFDGKNALDYNYFYQPKPIHTTTFAVYVKDAISYHHYGVTIPAGC